MKFSLDEFSGFMIYKTSLKLKNALSQEFRAFDITPEQWGVLNRLWEKDGISQRKLAEKTFKDQPNITRILDKLERKGVIRREANPNDRRAFLIFLTEDGLKLKDKLVPSAINCMNKAFTGISNDEVEQLKTILKKICANIEA